MTTAVGLVGRTTDPHAATIASLTEAGGARVTVVDTSSPSFSRWQLRAGRLVDHRGRPVELDAVYVRSVAMALPRHHSPEVAGPDMPAWLARAERNRRAHLDARAVHLALQAAGALVVNPVDATWLHRSKPAADLRLRAAGIPTPRCLVTDDPEAVRDFVGSVGEAICKPVAGGGACLAVDPASLGDADLACLATAPALFQERVRGDDLRIYVLDGEVIGAAHIHTTAVDFWGNEDAVVALAVDDELAGLCRRATTVLGLIFSGIDVKRSDDGRLTVLDVNPSPMFLGVQKVTGQPIAERLAARLVGSGA